MQTTKYAHIEYVGSVMSVCQMIPQDGLWQDVCTINDPPIAVKYPLAQRHWS